MNPIPTHEFKRILLIFPGLGEFQARAKSGQYLLIEMSEKCTKWCMSNRPKEEFEEVNADYAMVILLSLDNPDINRKTLSHRIIGSSSANISNNFRQDLYQINQKLHEITGRKDLKVFEKERLTEEIRFLGLVQGSAFRRYR